MSKKDIMNEIIMKSKLAKIEKKEQSTAQKTLLESLDVDFKSIISIINDNDVKLRKELTEEEVKQSTQMEDEMDEFMAQVRKMKGSTKSYAGNKLKNTTEMASLERDKLIELEKTRNKEINHIPYIINIVTTLDDFINLLNKKNINEQKLVLQRMLIYNHPILSQQNYQHMSQILFWLWQYIKVICLSTTTTTKLDIQAHLYMLQNIVIDMHNLLKASSSRLLQVKLKQLYHKLFDINLLHNTDDDDDQMFKINPDDIKYQINSFDLFLLSTIYLCYPIDLKKHDIITPTRLLLCQIITRLPIVTSYDLYIQIFSLSLLINKMNKKMYIPELLDSLLQIMKIMLYKDDILQQKYRWKYATSIYSSWLLILDLEIKQQNQQFQRKISFSKFMNKKKNKTYFNSIEGLSASLFCCLRILETLLRVYSSLDSFIELFQPFLSILSFMNDYMLSKAKSQQQQDSSSSASASSSSASSKLMSLKQVIQSLYRRIQSSITNKKRIRKPLKQQIQVKELNKLEPAYEMDYFAKKRQKDEIKKLQQKVNREKRGAMSEIRKDTQYIAQLKKKNVKNKINNLKRNIMK